jgi:hypothetical protein
MSRLEYFSRPWVAFDADNKEHRRYYAEFLKFNTWGRCPVRFLVTDEYGMDLVIGLTGTGFGVILAS